MDKRFINCFIAGEYGKDLLINVLKSMDGWTYCYFNRSEL